MAPDAIAMLLVRLERAAARHQYGAAREAVLELFRSAPARAYDHLAPYFAARGRPGSAGDEVVFEVLRAFVPAFRWTGTRSVPEWSDPELPGWLLRDVRWLELCASLRRDTDVGPQARTVLRSLPSSPVQEALERVRRGEPRVERRIRTAAAGDLLSRYRRGEHRGVWEELRAAGAVDGAFREEALEVSRETMRRFAAAVDELAERLATLGWHALAGRVRTRPARGDERLMSRAEELTGAPLPPALRAFWEVVGGVDLVWDYHRDEAPPDLGLDLEQEELDALSVGPAADIQGAIERWEDENRDVVDPELGEPFRVDLAPDALTKANVSGGGPYGIDLPCPEVEPRFGNEEWSAPLVEYLRDAVRWGGFPGLAHLREREDVARVAAKLSEGLEPF